jgi:hypothetical protein
MLKPMRSSRTVLAALAVLATLGPALAAQPAAAARPRARPAVAPAALRHSLDLWATIDVCGPTDQPHTVGVRGSMPGDRDSRDSIYMRFRLQFMDGARNRWVDVRGANSGFLRVGSARAAREDGWSFQLKPIAGHPAATLRGVVMFQWRRGAVVLASISRASTAGHQSVAGADPPNYSAATCLAS